MITCVLWRGDFRNRDYTHDHVARLCRMCHRWLSTPFEFVCLTNDIKADAPYRQIPLRFANSLVGWWAKLELFMGLPLTGPVLYLDLDTFICGELDSLVSFQRANAKSILFAPPLGTPSNDPKIKAGVVTRFQSSVIGFTAGNILLPPDIQEPLVQADLRQKYRGDQDFFGDFFLNVGATFPKGWFIKLKHCWNSGPPPGVKIIFGHPKPLYNRALSQAWVKGLVS